MDKVKKILFSENGMKVVNLIFFLALLIPYSGIMILAYVIWIAYLVFCIKNSPSRASRVTLWVLVAFAGIMIVLNIYFMLSA